MPADQRSMHPNMPGVPWWGAVLIAVTATAIGFAFDAGANTRELGAGFAAMYVIGCLAALVATRRAAIFTAVVQPPLILFVSVPGAYFLFQADEISGLRDLLITCGYPLIERFPLMLFTSAAVLLLAVVRWYLGMSARSGVNVETSATPAGGRVRAMAAKLTGRLSADPGGEDPADSGRHAAARATRNGARRSAPTPAADSARGRRKPARERSRRQTAAAAARRPAYDESAYQPRRRSRGAAPWEAAPPAEPRRRREPAARTSRDRYERRDARAGRAPYDRGGGAEGRDPYESYERPLRRGRAGSGAAASAGTHHPISQVRYRRSAVADEERSPRRGSPRGWDADGFQYDV